MSDEMWVAHGMNYHDRAGPPFLGNFRGLKEDVIDWIVEKHDKAFQEDLKKRYGSTLERLKVTDVTAEAIKRLREAKAQKKKADAEFDAAKNPRA